MSGKKDIERAEFNDAKDKYLVEALLQQRMTGKQAESGFKKEAWDAIVSSFNKTFKTKYIDRQFKSHFALASICCFLICVLCMIFTI
jgi:Myb/SANT-like DNA-binding domain